MIDEEKIKEFFDGIIRKIETYRSNIYINETDDKARIVFDLSFPNDKPIYHILRSLYANNKQIS